MMKAWQRRANKLALDWGVANRRQVEVIRKGFEGWARTSAITGESEPHYPEWRRSVKYVLTGVVMLMQILMMVLIVCALYVGYFLVNSKYTGFPKYALNLGLSTAWGLSLELLNWIVWFKVAVRLTDFENHKTVQQHEDKLIIKIFVFYFIDCFLWFFILAFFQIPFGAWVNDRLADLNLELIPFERPVWMARLGQTIGAVLSITQWSMVLFADAYVPYLVRQWRLRREAKAAAGGAGGGGNGSSGSSSGGGGGAVGSSTVELEMAAARDSPERFPTPDSPQAPRSSSRDSISGAAMGNGNGSGGGGGGARGGRMRAVLEEGEMTPYDPMLDYSGIVIQFGYVTMFSAVWPLAALVCLGHTIFRLRSNVLRLTRLSMRPVPEATSGIGLWHNLLLFEARACVLVNCLIVSVSTDQLDYFSCWSHSLWREEGDCEQGSVPMTSRFLIAVAAEHIVLGLVFLIDQGVPNMQTQLTIRMKKAAFIFKKRYWETYAAEQAMAGTALRGDGRTAAPHAAAFQPRGLVDYDDGWRSGSDVSDAYDELTEAELLALRDSSPTVKRPKRKAARTAPATRLPAEVPAASPG